MTTEQKDPQPNASNYQITKNNEEVLDPENALTYYKAIKIAQDCAADSDCHQYNFQLEQLRAFFLQIHLDHFTISTTQNN